MELATESRKGGLALVASHQYLDQFDRSTERLKIALMGSTQTKVLFQLGMVEAEEYEGLLSTDRPESDVKASDLQNLGHRFSCVENR